MLMPRTIDKLRAMLPGGNRGEYKIPGLSQWLLEIIGVKEDDLREAVAKAKTDDDVAAWLRAHADTSKYAEANERLSNRKITEAKDPATLRERYPILDKRPDIKTLFEMVDADDSEAFSRHA